MAQEPEQAEGVSTDTPKAPAEPTAAGSQPTEQTTQPDKPEGQPAEKKDDKPSTAEPAKDSKPTPTSRRSGKFRIEQLARENAQLRKQIGKAPKQEGNNDEGNPPADNDNPPQPDVQQAVRDETQRLMKPLLDSHSEQADNDELNALFTGDLAAHKSAYEARIRESWKLDQYKDLAASDVFKILDYDAAVARATTAAVEAYKKAEKEAKESSGSGASTTSNRAGNGGKPVSQMTDEELIAHNERVKFGQTS